MYIYDALVISPQATFSEPEWMQQLRVLEGLKYQALEPDYSGSIKPAQLRRMGKALRMGVGCGAVLLENHGPVDGILIGTSEGGLEGCIQDRKSTRLNSSHVRISYAVFCLKK